MPWKVFEVSFKWEKYSLPIRIGKEGWLKHYIAMKKKIHFYMYIQVKKQWQILLLTPKLFCFGWQRQNYEKWGLKQLT
jgi:hypothetical protein